MKAIVQERYGAPARVLRLRKIDPPPVGADDVLLRVRATSVNTPDYITVTRIPYILRLRLGLAGGHRCGGPTSRESSRPWART
jgi:NADPH:quinone reductase-like Zn-dependent oxidoreductase